MQMTWKAWGIGLLAAVVSGVADALVLNMIDPATFNTGAGLKTLLTVTLFFGVKAGAYWLKSHPVPGSAPSAAQEGK